MFQDYLAKPASEYTGVRGFTCDLAGCQNKELTPVVCEKCNKNFCLRYEFVLFTIKLHDTCLQNHNLNVMPLICLRT